MSIFLIIIIIGIACWPWISRWLRGYMARRAEDYLRRATGMPPRPGSREEKRQQRASRQNAAGSGKSSANTYFSRRSRSQKRTRRNPNEPIIPKEYAEDVEFVETKSYSETTIGESSAGSARQYAESQVSDVEFVEIKEKRSARG